MAFDPSCPGKDVPCGFAVILGGMSALSMDFKADRMQGWYCWWDGMGAAKE